MGLYLCQGCGGQLSKKPDGTYVCLFCGTLQTFNDHAPGTMSNSISCSSEDCANDKAAIYSQACLISTDAASSSDYENAEALFSQILDYLDASVRAADCHRNAELLRIEEAYIMACKMIDEHNIYFMQQAADIFSSIGEYKDSKNKYAECIHYIETQEVLLARKNAELKHSQQQEAKRYQIIFLVVLIAIFIFFILLAAAGR